MNDIRKKIKQLMNIMYNIDVQYMRASNALGYKANMFWFLYSLDNNPPMSQKQIINDWDMPKTTLNTLVKECEEKGFLTFKSIEGSRREKIIIITESGKKYAQKMLKKIYEAENEAFMNTPGHDKLIELTNLYYENLKKSFCKVIINIEK